VCLIIDSNVVHKISDVDHQPIMMALAAKKATLVYGGELRREYRKIKDFYHKILLRLDQSGAAKIYLDKEIDQKTDDLKQAGGYSSDDPHILALAIVTGARLVCSEDNAVCSDFKNKTLINNPRGSVYRKASHAHLIRKHCT
jgi:hypothetical protein